MANRLFRKLNADGTGRLTREELLQFYAKASQGKDHVSFDDFRDALLGGMSGGFQPGDAPSPAVLIRGLFAGEIGSMYEGPKLNEPAPNFTLKTVDGKDSIQLAKLIGSKPVVLVFGNFTCGPFRSFYPDVDTVYQRHKSDADFLMVYVREAHPTDGWKMESNSRAGVTVKQPATFDDRVTVAGQFCKRIKPTMPVVVDELNDAVGHAYSGMPARLYIIDGQGKVAYKSGRGPFGFRVGEMEQALVMLLLDQQKPARTTASNAASTAGK
jgi:alkyl hydroperoxide reductase subunit AhpC